MSEPSVTYVLSTTCGICNRVRNDDDAYLECICHGKRNYTADRESDLRSLIMMLNEAISGITRLDVLRNNITVFDAERIIRIFMSMWDLSIKLKYVGPPYPAYGSCLDDVADLVEKVIIRVRSTARPKFLYMHPNGLDTFLFFMHMTPKMARSINYSKCIYLDEESHPCEMNTKVILCQAHIGLFYVARNELTYHGVCRTLVDICLDYLMLDHQSVSGCIPSMVSDLRDTKRRKIERAGDIQ